MNFSTSSGWMESTNVMEFVLIDASCDVMVISQNPEQPTSGAAVVTCNIAANIAVLAGRLQPRW